MQAAGAHALGGRPERGRLRRAAERVDQHLGVERAARVERRLRRPEAQRERIRSLTVIPGTVIATHRVVVGDRAAAREYGVRRRLLDLCPLLQSSPLCAGARTV